MLFFDFRQNFVFGTSAKVLVLFEDMVSSLGQVQKL